MKRARAVLVVVGGVVTGLGLSGCDQIAKPADPSVVETPAAPAAARTETRDVERPDVFSKSELALWDGRPSLGGIWVAYPGVKDPERVMITNTTNGESVAGALFRRERDNPGPRIQLSSDAADALGVLAGQPTKLSVVALRQEEVTIPAAPAPEAAPGAAADGTAPAPDAKTSDSKTPATKTADSTSTETKGDAKTAGAAIAAAGATASAATVAADEAAAAPKQGFWARFRDSLRNKPKTDTAAAAATTGAGAAAVAGTAASPKVDTAPLDPIASAAAAIDKAEAKGAASAANPKAKTPPPAALKSPYVQVGLFSVEENATSAASALRQAGIVPEVDTTKSNGKTFWRVLVGPMTSGTDQTALLAQIKKLGYSDAFLTDK